jgi:electron transfer flavoprotein-quinone oxidoreductase
MKETFDVAIVGAGPAGIAAACTLARKGVKTIVLERGEQAGAKNVSGGVLYGHDLRQILPDFESLKCPIERNIMESRLWYLSREGGYSLAYRDSIFSKDRKYNVFTIGRARFDRWFADQATNLGALVVYSTIVTDFIRDSNNHITGVRTDRPDGDLTARVVLIADGINSPLAARTGFRPEPKPDQVALAVKEVLELPEEQIQERFNVAPEDGVTIEILGEVTQGMNGVAALYTNRKHLSLCIGANLSALVRTRIKPYEMIENFKEHPMVSPLIEGAKPVEYMAHWLAEGGYDAIPPLWGDGFLIAGDSAMLFNAPHREGSNMAMTSGRLAAEAIMEALAKNDVSRAGLQGYFNRLQDSYILTDLKKYRRWGKFLEGTPEIFTSLAAWSGEAAREMITVNGVPKREKQRIIGKYLRRRIACPRLLRIIFAGWRSVR